MKNKYYNIFFTSEKDGLGKSFRFSKITFMSVGVLFSAMIIFAYVGFTRIVGFDAITYELDQLRKYKYITSNLLIESGSKTTTIDSEDMEEIIINYIIANDMIYPSSAPIDGYVTKGVLRRDNEIIHAGINVASKIKDQIKVPLDGLVVVANNDELESTIIIHHQNNFFTVYKNLDQVLVNSRDLVFKDQVIGTTGLSDNEDSYLHFEIWKDNQVIDPRSLVADYKEKDVSIR